MRTEETRLATERNEFPPQLLRGPMRGLSRIGLKRKNPLSHKSLGVFLQLDEIVRERKVHQRLRVDAKPRRAGNTSSGFPAGCVKVASSLVVLFILTFITVCAIVINILRSQRAHPIGLLI
jgi:hypothetical protein